MTHQVVPKLSIQGLCKSHSGPESRWLLADLYVFGPSGCWTIAPLHYAAKFDPFLSLDCAPHALHPSAIQGKEGIKFCHLATMHSPSDQGLVLMKQAMKQGQRGLHQDWDDHKGEGLDEEVDAVLKW